MRIEQKINQETWKLVLADPPLQFSNKIGKMALGRVSNGA